MQLAVVILNFRTASLTIDCLESLATQMETGRDVAIVVDNGSGDGSVERIQGAIQSRGWGRWARLIPSEANLGFPGGCNFGIKAVEADAYILLNNDTLVRPGAISSLLMAMAEHPRAGIIGPRIEGVDATPQVSCFRFRTPLSELIRAAGTGPLTRILKTFDVPLPVSDAPVEPQWLGFPCVLIRRQVTEEIGLLEEGYFLYFDDIDYCRRARRAGWGVLYWPGARVVHLGGGSNPLEAATAARRRKPGYYYESRARYFAKFYGRAGLWAANLLWMAGRAISLAREVVGRKQPHACPREWLDNWTNWLSPFKPPTRWNGKPS